MKHLGALLRYPLVWAIVCISLFFHKQIFGGEVLYCCDNLLITIPAKQFLVDRIRAGEFPFWNPMILSGMPYLADINLATLYPSTFLYFLLSPFRAVTFVALLHYAIALIGMYKLVRLLNVSPWAALAAAIVYSFSGTLVTFINNIPMLQVAAVFPWMVWSWGRLAQTQSPRWLVAVAVTIALSVLAGHLQITYYSVIFGMLFFIVVSPGTYGKKIGFIVLAFIPAIALTALQTIPFAELALQSTRTGRGLEYSTFGSLHPLWFIRFIFPSVVGSIYSGTDWVQGGAIYGFVGVLAMFSAFLGIGKDRVRIFLAISALVALVLAFGRYTPLFTVAYYVVPGISQFRMPTQFLLIWTLSVSMMAGFGVDRLFNGITLSKFIGPLVAGGSMIAALFVPSLSTVAMDFSRYSEKLGGKFTFLGHKGVTELATSVLLNIFVIGVGFLILRILVTSAIPRSFRGIGIGLLLFLELFLYSGASLTTVPLSQVDSWFSSQNTILPKDTWQSERIYIDPSAYRSSVVRAFGVSWLPEEIAWQISTLRPNTGNMRGLSMIDGYSSVILRRLADAVSASPQPDPTGVVIDTVDSEIFHTLGARTILTRDTSAYINGFPEKGTIHDLTVLENIHARPRLFGMVTEESIIPAEIRHYSANNAEILVNMPQDGVVVFSDSFYPGWIASVDGQQVDIVPYRTAVKAVAVPSGEHTVSFSFKPRLLNASWALTFGGLVILVLYWMHRDITITFLGGNTPSLRRLRRQK